MDVSSREEVAFGAKRTAFGDDGGDGLGDDGAMFLEGLISTTLTGRTYCFPRAVAIVSAVVSGLLSW